MGYNFSKNSNTSMLSNMSMLSAFDNKYENRKNGVKQTPDRYAFNSMAKDWLPEYRNDLLGGMKIDLVSRVLLHSKSNINLEIDYCGLCETKTLSFYSRLALFFKMGKTDFQFNNRLIENKFITLLCSFFMALLLSLCILGDFNQNIVWLSILTTPLPILLVVYFYSKVHVFGSFSEYSYSVLKDYDIDLSKSLIPQLDKIKDFLFMVKAFTNDCSESSSVISNTLIEGSFHDVLNLENDLLSSEVISKTESSLRNSLIGIPYMMFELIKVESEKDNFIKKIVSLVLEDINAYENSIKANIQPFLKDYVHRFSEYKDFSLMAETVKKSALNNGGEK